jgi:hypothetical protein
MHDALQIVPYVLRIDVREISGTILEDGGSVRVAVFVNGQEVHSRIHMISEEIDDVEMIEQWSNIEQHADAANNKAYFQLLEFSLPLVSVPVQSVKFVVFKFVPEQPAKVIAVAQEDLMLKRRLWNTVNK